MTRHPITGELIENEAEWKDANGEWLEEKNVSSGATKATPENQKSKIKNENKSGE